jgi:hypothetical protein
MLLTWLNMPIQRMDNYVHVLDMYSIILPVREVSRESKAKFLANQS